MSDEKPGPAPTDKDGGGARPDESGYRRDDYWRQQQEDLPADAGTDDGVARDFEPVDERVEPASDAPDETSDSKR